jgi:hypothetical protein
MRENCSSETGARFAAGLRGSLQVQLVSAFCVHQPGESV